MPERSEKEKTVSVSGAPRNESPILDRLLVLFARINWGLYLQDISMSKSVRVLDKLQVIGNGLIRSRGTKDMASNNNSISNSKKNKGRQKIEMKKMTKESNLQVTFSKRRGGLFKKASELSTLCGVDVALIVFSPGNKAYSFGHPSVESLIQSFIEGGGPPHLDSAAVHHHFTEEHDDLNTLLTKINAEIEEERKLMEEMNCMRKEAEGKWWWAAPLDEMNMPKLNEYKAALEELKKSVTCHFEKLRGKDNGDPATVVAAAVMASSNNNMVPVPVPVPVHVPLPMPLPPIFFSSLFQNSHHHQMHNNNNNNNNNNDQRYEDESSYQFYSYTAMMQGGGSPFGPYTTARNNSGF
ncbi:hypothetical protein PIB30_009242 [Stylosanthes scabra]|uniref:MADS-box domain-containing protein n=1 Tax=Stylosanthes scabra TaxID=79078 RepID=A0ABU6R411_9FABA|nr:hypothetical protein [Stylosanthes scabra]